MATQIEAPLVRQLGSFGKYSRLRSDRACGPLLVITASIALITWLAAQTTPATSYLALDSITGLEIVNGKANIADYRGRRALHLTALPDSPDPNRGEAVMAIVAGVDFRNGTIEADIAGMPLPSAPADSRGFIGVNFRVQQHGARLENIYLRPTNGRADDQLRRNHSVQYESIPDFPWFRLRKESPGAYESYADLEAGAWTNVRIVVSGTRAQLYVNGSAQPCLIVNDLKQGESHGQVALWSHSTTDGYFSNLRIRTE